MNSTQKVYRSETDKIIAGVAGGLGDYFELDPSLIRLLFLLFTLAGGSGVLIYLILWIVIPSRSKLSSGVATEQTMKDNVKEIEKKAKDMAESVSKAEQKHTKEEPMSKQQNHHEPRRWFGIFLLILGGLWLLRNMGLINPDVLWPLAIITIGVLTLIR